MSTRSLSILLLALCAFFATSALASSDTVHKLVIQVSTDDERTQAMAMNNAVNLQQHYGIDNVQVEIVVYGPGLSMLTTSSKHAQRVASLGMQQVSFTACGNTIAKVEKGSGKPVELNQGVNVVPAGVVRILELQNQGYGYLRP